MTLFLDSSAVVAVNIDGVGREVVIAALVAEPVWCASALALCEALALVDRLTEEAELRAVIEDGIRGLWDRLHVVPVDQRCLDEAARLAREQPVHVNHAIHLGAADRLPRPIRFATLDAAQIPVAMSLGFEVVST